MFSMLGNVTEAHVLDLYAGSGALGIEALSRGARRAVFVEKDRAALATLRQNLATLHLVDVSDVIATTVSRAQPLLRGRAFDLVLVDPPYADAARAAGEVSRLAESEHGLAQGARIVIEHASRDPAPVVAGGVRQRTRVYGDTALSCYVVAPPSVPVPDC
jgi:16S rRNA (guanine966-N2)-methyltransferase